MTDSGTFGVAGLEEIKPLQSRITKIKGSFHEEVLAPWEIMDKINEIAEKVNILIQQVYSKQEEEKMIKIFKGKDLKEVELASSNFFAFMKNLKIQDVKYFFPAIQTVIMTVFYEGCE